VKDPWNLHLKLAHVPAHFDVTFTSGKLHILRPSSYILSFSIFTMYFPTHILLVAVLAGVHVHGLPVIKSDKIITAKATIAETAPSTPPLCSWDPKIGQYVCPGATTTTTQTAPKPTGSAPSLPPLCTWDPKLGQNVCPE
jgi:hypothetical protein